MNLNQKIGQFFSPAAYIHDTEENIQALEQMIVNYEIGGVTFFHSRHSAAANFEQRQEKLTYENTLEKLIAQINRYQKISKTPLLISIDAEFGLAMRIENTPHYPYAIAMGNLSLDDLVLVESYGEMIGRDLKACGIHLNFGPVADINTNPKNPVIGYRSFGTDREKVSAFALAYFRGLNKAGIAGCYKHFPGHGDTAIDSHLGLPIINKSKSELMEEELSPFIKGIAAGVDMVMVGHLAIPSLSNGKNTPATISKDIIQGLLREELGFDGIVVSDALNMNAVSGMFEKAGQLELEAFAAGNDLLCFSEDVAEGISAIAKHADPKQIEQSYQRIINLKKSLNLQNQAIIEVPSFDVEAVNHFNKALAKRYMHKSHPNECQNQEKASIGLSIGSPKTNILVTQATIPFVQSFEELSERHHTTSPIAICLFVPSAKPVNNFGLDLNILGEIGELIKNQTVDLYLFGNPLSLPLIPNADKLRSVTVAFHDFEVNQEVVLEAFQA